MTILIGIGVALAAFLAYKLISKKSAQGRGASGSDWEFTEGAADEAAEETAEPPPISEPETVEKCFKCDPITYKYNVDEILPFCRPRPGQNTIQLQAELQAYLVSAGGMHWDENSKNNWRLYLKSLWERDIYNGCADGRLTKCALKAPPPAGVCSPAEFYPDPYQFKLHLYCIPPGATVDAVSNAYGVLWTAAEQFRGKFLRRHKFAELQGVAKDFVRQYYPSYYDGCGKVSQL